MTVPKNDDDMIGFQDFLDGQEEKRIRGNKRIVDSGHELLSFLEKENKRLELLTRLYDDQTEMMKHYPQAAIIIVDLETNLSKNKIKLIDHFKGQESHLRRNLREIYKNFFSS